MNRREINKQSDQLMVIIAAKLKAARKDGIEKLQSSLIREVRNSLATVAELLTKVDELDGVVDEPVEVKPVAAPPKPKPKKTRKVKPVKELPPKKPTKADTEKSERLKGLPKVKDMGPMEIS